MTTIAAPQEQTPRVLLAGSLAVLATTTVLTVLAATTADAPGVRGGLLGGGIVLGFFVFGTVSVGFAARMVPATALMVAMLTYTLQVVVIGLVFVALKQSGLFEDDLSDGWLAAGLIAGTFSWMIAQLVATLRTPIAPWEPSEAKTSGTPGAEVPGEEVGTS
jgi:hypothetical protein